MLKEFKEFAAKGNVVDLAIGVVIGGAFATIVKSFVDDILMPPIGLLLGKVDFSSLFVSLNGESYPSLAAAQAAGAPVVRYGIFVNTVIDFVIVAFVIFLVVKAMNNMKKEEAEKPAAPPAPSAEERLLGEIRDLLKAR